MGCTPIHHQQPFRKAMHFSCVCLISPFVWCLTYNSKNLVKASMGLQWNILHWCIAVSLHCKCKSHRKTIAPRIDDLPECWLVEGADHLWVAAVLSSIQELRVLFGVASKHVFFGVSLSWICNGLVTLRNFLLFFFCSSWTLIALFGKQGCECLPRWLISRAQGKSACNVPSSVSDSRWTLNKCSHPFQFSRGAEPRFKAQPHFTVSAVVTGNLKKIPKEK